MAGLALLLFTAAAFADGHRQARSNLTLDSSDPRLVQAFNWAKRQALAYAFEDDPVGPWYEAALPGREAFCMRDVAHQSMGAQALGLAAHNSNMLHRFAENISQSKDWCSYWEMNRFNQPSPADYKNDREFWYCLPANYDVLDACYRMYVWSGDQAYIKDPGFLNFYERTVADFEQRWNLDLAHVMKRRRWIEGDESASKEPFQFFRGNPGYAEAREPFVLGVDLLATQYAAYLAYAHIEEARQNDRLADEYRLKAAAVKKLINDLWWDQKEQQFYARLSPIYQFEGHETADLLYRAVIEDGPKLKSTLDALLRNIKQHPSSGVEVQSHYPEILYSYGAPDVAYLEMMDLAREDRERREYPEVSFSVVGAMVSGLMGVTLEPTASQQFIRTQSGLGSIAWAELRNLPVRANLLAVRQDGPGKTSFTNQQGPTVIWRASFAGSFDRLVLNGKRVVAHREKGVLDSNISFVDVPVAPGETAKVEIPK
jgi:hypothetical protein